MFWATNNPAAVGVPFALLILSVTPKIKLLTNKWLLIVVVIFVTISYTISGVPFINKQNDTVVRLLHFFQLLLICFFVLHALIKRPSIILGEKNKDN
jgi:hypothetical protein